MYKENLFKLIRSEDVVLWAGSGLSIYAGYPSGKKLGEILLSSLSEEERRNISSDLLLPDLAEEYFRIKGNNKNALIQILKKTFNEVEPERIDIHQKLSSINHIKTIITTNYDNLFEKSYIDYQVITSSSQIPYINNNKTQIFKIHGDLNHPESIILTTSDYNNFFMNNRENDVLWSVIKERVSTKTVLFVGYNLEDPNITTVFDKITSVLDVHKKECFLVAPGLPEHKVNNLRYKNIHYIDSTAEKLVEELVIDINNNILADLEAGNISADTCRLYLKNNQLLSDMSSTDNAFKIKSIKGVNDNVKGLMTLNLVSNEETKEFLDYINGKKYGNFEISRENLKGFELKYGNIKVVGKDNMQKVNFQSVPQLKLHVTFRFPNKLEIEDIPIDIYGNENQLEFHLNFPSAQIEVIIYINRVSETKSEIKYRLSEIHKELCKSIKKEIELYSFLKNIGEGGNISVFPDKMKPLTKKFPRILDLSLNADTMLSFFKNLDIIEKNFNIRFEDIKYFDISDHIMGLVSRIVSVVTNKEVKVLESEKRINIPKDKMNSEASDYLKSEKFTKSPLLLCAKVEEKINLFGHIISIGYKNIEFKKPFISNFDLVLNNKVTYFSLRSIDDEVKIYYTKTIS